MTVDLEALGLPARRATRARRRVRAPVGRPRRRQRHRRGEETVPSSRRRTSSIRSRRSRPTRPRRRLPGRRAVRVEPGRAATSWQTTAQQNGVQAFYLVSYFHEHLAGAAIGFDAASGNFEDAAPAATPVDTQTLDGASTGPDANHVNNANMSTPPDGYAAADADVPVPQRQRGASTSPTSTAATTPASSGTSTATGSPTGSSPTPTARAPQHAARRRDGRGVERLVRVGPAGPRRPQDRHRHARRDRHRRLHRRSTRTRCATQAARLPGRRLGGRSAPAAPTTGTGGYTLGDFGNVFVAGPEVHADGEIWAETLWDLRQALGRHRRGRLRHRGDARHRRDAPVAARAVDARHAQRDPERRPGRLRRRQRGPASGRSSARAAWATSPAASTAPTPSRSRTSRATPADGRAHRHGHGRRHGRRGRAPDRGRRRSGSAATRPATRRSPT